MSATASPTLSASSSTVFVDPANSGEFAATLTIGQYANAHWPVALLLPILLCCCCCGLCFLCFGRGRQRHLPYDKGVWVGDSVVVAPVMFTQANPVVVHNVDLSPRIRYVATPVPVSSPVVVVGGEPMLLRRGVASGGRV